MNKFPSHAISILQPWAWLIVNGFKDIENRSRRFNVQGPLAIHASARFSNREWYAARMLMRDRKIRPPIEVGPELPLKDELDFGSIIGVVNVVACVENSHSPWFVGPHGLVIESPIALQRPVPCKGSLGIWRIPDDIRAAADEALPRQGGAR